MDTRKLTYSRTIEVSPENADLLNHLVDKYIVPVIEKRIAQGAISQKPTPEEQLEAILNFGRSERIEVQTQKPKSIAQGGLDSAELENLNKLLEFGRKGIVKPTQGATE